MIISVITPVFRSANSILPLYNKITAVVQKLDDFLDYEIIMVEDCGGDDSWKIIENIAKNDSHLKGIQLSRNYGQQNAITAGLDICNGDWIVVLDCDLQDDPDAILPLWQKAKEGYEVVNVRRKQRQDSWIKKYRSRLYHMFFEWISGMAYDPDVASYRIISKKVLFAYNQMREQSRGFSIQVHWLGFPTSSIDYQHASRFDGKSSYNLKKLISLAVDVAVSYSNKPLYISIFLGSFISCVSFCIALWFFIRKIFWQIPVAGWTSLVVSVWFLGGIILANIGVIGIYIGKIFNETKNRPIYAISKKINF
jgi:dolichol-phosphate mannosyltransferase